MLRRFWSLAVLTVIGAILLLNGMTLAAPPRIPPDARGYQRYLLQQNAAAAPVRDATTAVPMRRTYTWDLPPEVPLDRTYTWYAPPSEFKVVIMATPSQPRWVTIVQPDGSKRTFALEGPIVVRRPVVVRR